MTQTRRRHVLSAVGSTIWATEFYWKSLTKRRDWPFHIETALNPTNSPLTEIGPKHRKTH